MFHIAASEASGASYSDVAQRLNTDVHSGLTHAEASQRRRIHGFNEFNIAEEEPLWKKYLQQVWLFLVKISCTPRCVLIWYITGPKYFNGLGVKTLHMCVCFILLDCFSSRIP